MCRTRQTILTNLICQTSHWTLMSLTIQKPQTIQTKPIFPTNREFQTMRTFQTNRWTLTKLILPTSRYPLRDR